MSAANTFKRIKKGQQADKRKQSLLDQKELDMRADQKKELKDSEDDSSCASAFFEDDIDHEKQLDNQVQAIMKFDNLGKRLSKKNLGFKSANEEWHVFPKLNIP